MKEEQGECLELTMELEIIEIRLEPVSLELSWCKEIEEE